MRVLHLINIGGFGGAEKLVVQLLPALNNEVNAELLICHKEGNEQAALKSKAELEEKNVTVHIIAYQRVLSLSFLRILREFLSVGNYDLIHAHLQQACTWMGLLKRFGWFKKTVVSTLHGFNDSYQNKHGLKPTTGLYFSPYYWFVRLNLRKLDRHIAVSNCMKEFYAESGVVRGKDVEVIYNGYDAKELAMTDITSKHIGKLDAPNIVLPGRLIKLKGHIYAMQMLALLKKSHPGAVLHFYGSGPFQNEIESEISRLQLNDSVRLHGYVHNVLDEIRKSDFAVLPSSYESFGMVFLDCFAAGVPVIAFDLPAGNEIVHNGENGLLVPAYDVNQLADKAASLCEDAGLRKSLSEKGRQSMLERFSIEKMAKAYAQFYKNVLKAGN